MAVYTQISVAELERALGDFGLQLAGAPEAVADGIENTTYFFNATAESGEPCTYVLTIFENCPQPQWRYASGLTSHLHRAGLPVPCPLHKRGGECEFWLAGKTALIFPKIRGAHLQQPGRHGCEIIGNYLAHSHLAGQSFTQTLANSRGLSWLSNACKNLSGFVTADDNRLLDAQLERYQKLCNSNPNLPFGAIHGDLFRDNALFSRHQLVAVIDFYNACNDWWLLDVAIAINDWCSTDNDRRVDNRLAQVLLNAYHRVRPFTRCEQQCWQDILCIAATRFWVSRLLGVFAPQLLGSELKTKDPNEYKLRLQQHMASFPPLPKS